MKNGQICISSDLTLSLIIVIDKNGQDNDPRPALE